MSRHSLLRRCAAGCAVAALVGGASAVHAEPILTGLGDLSGGFFASDGDNVSADGLAAVGNSDAPAGSEAFRWTSADGITGLGVLPGDRESDAYAVSNAGAVVVGVSTNSSGESRAFRWTSAGGMTTLGPLPPGGIGSLATGVSADGSVISGMFTTSTGREAYRWTTSDGYTTLGELSGGIYFTDSWAMGISSNGSSIVGRSINASGFYEAFRWRSAGGMLGLGDLTGGITYSEAHAASSDGSVVVGLGNSASGPEAFRWEADVITGLGDLPGGAFSSVAWGVSADGSVIVGDGMTADGSRAFIWTAADGMRNLHDVLLAAGTSGLDGWTLYSASGISGDGLTIVGRGLNPEGAPEGWIVTIPEPTTAAACALPLGGALLGRRRRHDLASGLVQTT